MTNPDTRTNHDTRTKIVRISCFQEVEFRGDYRVPADFNGTAEEAISIGALIGRNEIQNATGDAEDFAFVSEEGYREDA